MKAYYEIFGLTLSSDWVLPRLKAVADPRPVDVQIKKAAISPSGIPNPRVAFPSLQLAPDTAWLSIDQVGRFLVTSGERIEVDPDPDADLQSVLLYVLGSCLGAIMHQREQLILHANAIDVGGQALVFAGPSGIGKSTIAACFYKKGYRVLADDLTVIDGNNKVLPSYPQIKLWSDSIAHLDLGSIRGIQRIRMQVDKFEVPINDLFQTEPTKVNTIYLLGKGNTKDVMVEEVFGLEKLAALQRQVFRRRFAIGMGLQKVISMHCVRLAQVVRVVRITRPQEGFEPDRLIELALDDYRFNGDHALRSMGRETGETGETV